MNFFNNISRRLGLTPDYRLIEGCIIPAPDLRWCGPDFKNDEYYLRSADKEAVRLRDNLDCSNQSAVLDIGCGQGRLAIGLMRAFPDLDYIGCDVDRKSIAWCRKHLHSQKANYNFVHTNVYNERYNRRSTTRANNADINVEDGSIDIAYLYSVFSHMEERDMRIYLSKIHSLLKPSGMLFFTTFVEYSVENVVSNPTGYIFGKNAGPLHVVRYDKGYLFGLLDEAGFEVILFNHRTETDSQSAIYARKIDQ